MAYTDNLDDLWGLPKLQAQKEAATSLVKEYLQVVTDASKQIRGLQMGFISTESLQKAQQLSQQAEKLTKDQIKNIELLAKARLAEAKADEAQSKAAMTARREKLQVEKDDLLLQKQLETQAKANTKALEAHAKALQKAELEAKKVNNEYEVMKRQYKAVADEAKRLGAAHGIESAEFKKAAASAHALHTQLLNIEMSVGQAQRQVGNYNVVGAQFNQLLRELPNAGISARTFIMSVSNNITYFAEAVKDARAQGQSWGAVLKTIGSSIFSLVGIMNIAIAVFTYWSLNSKSAASDTQTLTEKIDDLTDSTLRYIKAANEQSQLIGDMFNEGSKAQQRYIDLLVSQGATEEQLQKERKKLHDLRISELGVQIKTYDKVEKAVMKYAQSVKNGGESIYKTEAELNELLTKNLGLSDEQAKSEADKVKKVVAELQESGKVLSIDNFKFLQGIANEKIQLEEAVKDELNAIETDKYNTEREIRTRNEKEYKQYLAEQEKARKEAFQKIRQEEAARGGMGFLPSLQDIQQQIKDIENAGLSDRLNQALFVSEQDEKNALETLENQYAKGLMAGEEYEAEKLRIQNDYATKRVQLEIDTIKKLLANQGTSEAERLKLISKLNDLELGLAKDGNEEKLKAEEQYKQASIKIEQQRADIIKQIRSQLVQSVLQLGDMVIDKEQRNLDKKKTNLDIEKELEIAKINATSATEEEAAQRKFVLEQDIVQQKRAIAKKEEDIQKQRFLLEQAGALARVLINAQEATAKITAQAAVLSTNPVTAGLAASALSQIPLVQASAAISAALIAAQVLAYAEGTPKGGHKGGAALIGERNEPERVTEPSGKTYWVNKPTLFKNLPKGTEVVPLHKMNADSLDMGNMGIANAIMMQGGGNSAKTEMLLSQAVSKLDKISNKPSERIEIKDGSMFKTVTQGSIKYNYLRKNFLD